MQLRALVCHFCSCPHFISASTLTYSSSHHGDLSRDKKAFHALFKVKKSKFEKASGWDTLNPSTHPASMYFPQSAL
jgi:hypothetical protein